MEHRLFLTGADAQTRRRLIVAALGGKLAGAGGFVMLEEPEGCALCPAAAAAGVAGLECPRFLDFRAWPPIRDNEVLRSCGAQLLREAAFYPYAVLCELGGFETLIPQFTDALAALLASDVPLLGAVKPAEEAEQWRQLFGLGERFSARAAALRRALAAEGRLLDLDAASEEDALAALRAWAAEYA